MLVELTEDETADILSLIEKYSDEEYLGKVVDIPLSECENICIEDLMDVANFIGVKEFTVRR